MSAGRPPDPGAGLPAWGWFVGVAGLVVVAAQLVLPSGHGAADRHLGRDRPVCRNHACRLWRGEPRPLILRVRVSAPR